MAAKNMHQLETKIELFYNISLSCQTFVFHYNDFCMAILLIFHNKKGTFVMNCPALYNLQVWNYSYQKLTKPLTLLSRH